MKSWLNQGLKVLIHGIDTHQGFFYAHHGETYGKRAVAAIIQGHGEHSFKPSIGGDIPCFYLVDQAIAAVGEIDLAMIFVDSYAVSDAVQESIYAGVKHILIVTGKVPPQDMITLKQLAIAHGACLLGGGSSGILKPDQFHFGINDTRAYDSGPLGIISFSDNLTDYVAHSLSSRGIGQSLMVSLGNDPFIGASLHDWLPTLAADDQTKYILVLGLLYGDRHEAMLKFKESRKKGKGKPLIFYPLGLSTPLAYLPTNAEDIVIEQLGHRLDCNLAISKKISQLEEADITVVKNIEQLIITMKELMKR